MSRKKEAAGGDAVEVAPSAEGHSAPSLEVAGKNGQITELVHVTTVKSVELSEDRVVRVKLSPFRCARVFFLHVCWLYFLKCLYNSSFFLSRW